MSLQRRVEKGATHFVTRRVKGRAFLLSPRPELTMTFWYVLGVLAQEHGIVLHGVVIMSNHLHYLVTDPRGVLPAFMRDLHREVARAAKRRWGVDGTVFEDTDVSVVTVVGERGVVEQALYTALNPVKAGLVERAAHWPGVRWVPGMREITAKRPAEDFDERVWPEEVTLTFHPPPAWTGTEEQWHQELGRMLGAREAGLRTERIRKGWAVLGARRILDQNPRARPKTREPATPSRKPTLDTGGDGPLLKRLIAELKLWRRAYREALERWKQDKTTSFPVGTYWMCVHHGALCG